MLLALRVLETTEYTQLWQWPLVGVHPIMMEQLAQPGEGEGLTPIPFFYISTFTYKVVVYAPAERTDTLPLFLLCPYMYVLCARNIGSAPKYRRPLTFDPQFYQKYFGDDEHSDLKIRSRSIL
jgi:hypothetical protein